MSDIEKLKTHHSLIVEYLKQSRSLTEIADEFNTSKNVLFNYKKLYCNNIITYEDEEVLKILYKHKNDIKNGLETINSLKKNYKVSHKKLIRLSKDLDLHTVSPKHTIKLNLNKTYFDKINNENKAYWLGFIWADGHISKYVLHVEVSEKDKNHLNLLKKELYDNYTLLKTNGCFKLNVSSKYLVDSLKELEFKKKDERVIIPVMNNYFNHFLRGYFDGDGDINKKDKTVRISGRLKFLNNLLDVIKLTFTDISYNLYKNPNGKSGRITFHKKDSIEISNFMYNKASIFLKRKHHQRPL